MTIEPVPLQSTPMTPAEQQERAELFAQIRREEDVRRAQEIRRASALLKRLPDGVTDLDVAARFRCECHPWAGVPIHGQRRCHCQEPPTADLTLEEILATVASAPSLSRSRRSTSTWLGPAASSLSTREGSSGTDRGCSPAPWTVEVGISENGTTPVAGGRAR